MQQLQPWETPNLLQYSQELLRQTVSSQVEEQALQIRSCSGKTYSEDTRRTRAECVAGEAGGCWGSEGWCVQWRDAQEAQSGSGFAGQPQSALP